MSRGFTLVELMVVIVILGGLVAIVGPNLWGQFEDANVKTARMQMANFAHVVGIYYLDRRRMPADLDALTEVQPTTGEPYIRSIPRDPWGGTYELRTLGGSTFEIVCHGRDGNAGTDDDLRWPGDADDL